MRLFRQCLSVMLGMLMLCTVGCKPVSPIPTPEPTTPTQPVVPVLPTSATVKVMSWNILTPSWGGGPVDNRASGFIDTISEVLPDVIGVQEASQKWHDKFVGLPEKYVAVMNNG